RDAIIIIIADVVISGIVVARAAIIGVAAAANRGTNGYTWPEPAAAVAIAIVVGVLAALPVSSAAAKARGGCRDPPAKARAGGANSAAEARSRSNATAAEARS